MSTFEGSTGQSHDVHVEFAILLTHSGLNIHHSNEILLSLNPWTRERVLEVVGCFNEKRFMNLVLGILGLEDDCHHGALASDHATA